jgi:hypothetical protein
MGYLELLGLVVSGAGTLASILGIFFAIYVRQNGRMTREFIEQMHQSTQSLIKEMNKHLVKMDEHLLKMNEHLVKMDEHADDRHKEVIEVLSRLKSV